MKAVLKQIPKLELHCHLDGSVSVDYLKTQSEKQQVRIDIDKVTVDQNCQSLAEYLQSFDEILKVMQTQESLIEAVIDVARQAHEDGVKYIEVRFAPAFHQSLGLETIEILDAVCEGAQQAEAQFDLEVRLLVCGMKHHSMTTNQAIFDHLGANASITKYIVGVDLAGDEASSPTEAHEALIQYAKSKNLNITLHAGECGCVKNVYDAIQYGARRIGHGVAIFQDEQALSWVKEQDVLLEFCPNSNLQTKAIDTLATLDLPKLMEQEVAFLINTDNRTVTQTTLMDEYALLLEHRLLNMADIQKINYGAIDYSFACQATKDKLKRYFEEQ
ncbi:adenosine deaminase [Staphylococcus schleiferi]|uniref:adenosine deaminase n=1 Tax=Staphylococcus coagulans TaxID=74706 RepID=UPI00067A177E|nr:adenosine deaminase [Staphylococcus coagulans]AKS70170.1 adenosine deaminase [Staphylococcus schleiferi]AKS72289.1 adenosine deaminase [Staphylococcus schleiferi]AKS74577.1 adenosine deaminase [Staphylococcus schleiferi]MBT2832837.1 adenosine deaminase [Staphylococcus coagulans]